MGKPCIEHPNREATYCSVCVDRIEAHATEISRAYTIEEFVLEANRKAEEDGMASIYITVVEDIAESIKKAYAEEKALAKESP